MRIRTRGRSPDGVWNANGSRTLALGSTFGHRRQRTGRPPVVLVHGVVSSRYLPDLPGLGDSARPPQPLGIPELAEVLAAAIAFLGFRWPVVLGHSIGVQVAVELAVRRPAEVRGSCWRAPPSTPR